MDFSKWNLTYNAAAHFAAKEKYPNGLLQELAASGEESLDALCWALEELSRQGERIRRSLGYDPIQTLKAEDFKNLIRPVDLLPAKTAVLDAVNKGRAPTQEDEKEIDEVLAELQKKTGKN